MILQIAALCIGALLFVLGMAMWWPPGAVMAAGGILIAAGLFIDDGRRR